MWIHKVPVTGQWYFYMYIFKSWDTIILRKNSCCFGLCVFFRVALVKFIFPLNTSDSSDLSLRWIKSNYCTRHFTQIIPTSVCTQILVIQSLSPHPLFQTHSSEDVHLCLVGLRFSEVIWLWTKPERRQAVGIELFLFIPANTRGFGDHKYAVCWY